MLPPYPRVAGRVVCLGVRNSKSCGDKYAYSPTAIFYEQLPLRLLNVGGNAVPAASCTFEMDEHS